MLGSSSYEFNTTMECRDRSDDDSIMGGAGYNNINLLRNGRGCLLDGSQSHIGAPDVPPRNPTMSRMNGRVQGIANDLDMDFEPSCLVRTPSGNVYIPSGNLTTNKNINKGSQIDYKSNISGGSACSTPTKDTLKQYDRAYSGPMIPTRGIFGGSANNTLGTGHLTVGSHQTHHHHHYSTPLNFRKGFSSKCTWKCTAILVIMLCVILFSILVYMSASSMMSWSYHSSNPCTVLVKEKQDRDSQHTNQVDCSPSIQSSTNRPIESSSHQQQDHQQDSGSLGNSIGAASIPGPRAIPPDNTQFAEVELNKRLQRVITSYGYWNMQFLTTEKAYVKFNFTIPRGSSIGFYARRNALPTHTQYDFNEVLSGFNQRTSRAAYQPTIHRDVMKFMEAGFWFISLYNDDGHDQEVTFFASVSGEMMRNCPNGCSGNGQCLGGHCQCNAGFGGESCNESVCPVLCNQRGDYTNGECHCHAGWKGKECQLTHNECEVPDCNGHGHCMSGKCSCARGYKGKFCEEVDCPNPTCSNHGFCAEGICICKKGWAGLDCSIEDQSAIPCLPNCSNHGKFDPHTQKCICNAKFSGDDCSLELCDIACGTHGRCVDDKCQCDEGWDGEFCNTKLCDARCNDHGQCKNGTCLCVTGWNGKHCTIEGCPSGCNNHGQCRVGPEGMFECRCYDGWDGIDCSLPLEKDCKDGKDNDKDGLSDCEDPECCSQAACLTNQLCVSSPKPIDILLRKQPPAITASFFERMKFLIDEGSLQNYAKMETFNESRSAVVRGRVVTKMGMGLMGVRVSTTISREGFTITRDDGWFDLMINGGGAVKILFGRQPFRPQERIVNVPWNEVIVLDIVTMSVDDEKSTSRFPTPCISHDYDNIKPIVLATWKHGFQGSNPTKSAILAESQVVQESITIPGTSLNLIYHSSKVAGYLSTIELQLTPEKVPLSLYRVHLKITIEGILFEKIFEADPLIKFTYSWNRLNIYKQKVYGVTTAMVRVGYQYSDCSSIIWDIQTTKLSGHDMSISQIGGWNLDIHHRYNFHEGIIQMGDGTNIYLRQKPRMIETVMGDGHQRILNCAECDGQAIKQRLLAPVALAAAADGSVYVGDFNYIRKISTDGMVRTLVKLNATRVSYRYHMAISPLDGTIYISDPESHQIIRVMRQNDFTDPERNWEVFVGSGERCLPGDEAHCGDGSAAREAKLAYPKGIAVAHDGTLYFADGTNIRMVDRDGIISTIIGSHVHKSHWKPVSCEGTLKMEEVLLRWPTEVAINPLNGALHFLDDRVVMMMTPDGRLRVVAGRPLHCPAMASDDFSMAVHATLVMPQSIAFAPSGDLYIAESDSQRINRIRVVSTDGRISLYAGAESKCNCLERGCDCFTSDHHLATAAKFNTISALTVTPDSNVFIADQANYRVRSITSQIPASSSREYEIYNPETHEVYIFNRFGQHTATKNVLTGETYVTFSYNVNTSNGKLSIVTDAVGNRVYFLRDYSAQIQYIENSKGQKCSLKLSPRYKMLHEFRTPDNFSITYDYYGGSGLLKSRLDTTGRSFFYNYDEFGRCTNVVTPTGKVISLNFDLNDKGAVIEILENAEKERTLMVQTNQLVEHIGETIERLMIENSGGTIKIAPYNVAVSVETSPHAILSEIDPLVGETYPVPAKQKTELKNELVNRFEWRYMLKKVQNMGSRQKSQPVVKKLRINGEPILYIEYDKDNQLVTVGTDDKTNSRLLIVQYDKGLRPTAFRPQSGDYAHVEIEYDRYGRIGKWTWGDLKESYTYDGGRLSEIKYADDTSLLFTFKDATSMYPLKITTPRRSDYLLQYDESGALQSLTTPRGHIHTFSLQTSFGFMKYQYHSPTQRHPFELQYDDQGNLLAKILPHQSGKIVYVYDLNGRLETILAGLSQTHYTYQEGTGLLKQVEVKEPGFELRREFRYHTGLLKDEKIKFSSKGTITASHYKYQYDSQARVSAIEMTLDGKDLPMLRFKFHQNHGTLLNVSDLKISRNVNRTVIEDVSKNYFTITDYDEHGRVKSVLINIKSVDAFRLELEHDSRNRIKTHKVTIGRQPSMDKINYNADGHVMEVSGTNNWKYLYDENGNVVGIMEQGDKMNFGYDPADRVIQVGDVEFNTYDSRGFVTRRGEQKYRYNNRGQLTHAMERDKFQTWYCYDDLDRMVMWYDEKGNVTQFFYANLMNRNLVTHMHQPKSGRTFRFIYDDRSNLIAVETSDQRFYVATDQNGSPLAYFDVNANVVKQIRRTPFGKIIKDTNPEFYVPIGFHGGLMDPNTNLIYINSRLYDPTVGQWMTPDWERLANNMVLPTDVFTYRFRNNDPINGWRSQEHDQQSIGLMSDINSWIKMLGYDVDRMQGSKYINSVLHKPEFRIKSEQISPEFGAISGLRSIIDKIDESFSNVEIVPRSLLFDYIPITQPRIAYRRGIFGEGVLFSRVDNRALVSVIDSSNSVVQDVVSSVFNNSFFLDLHFNIHSQDVFYFVKDNIMKLRDDTEELRRLGGMFNVTTHDINDHGSENGKELRLHGSDAIVIIKYGVDPITERRRILKHAHKRAVDRAWENEKTLIAGGAEGSVSWTEDEKEELLQNGEVEHYDGVDIHSIHKYPQLADDPSNVVFQRSSKTH
ncbi:hypothetical protein ACKWTF_015326 [Chironomus riparius]